MGESWRSKKPFITSRTTGERASKELVGNYEANPKVRVVKGFELIHRTSDQFLFQGTALYGRRSHEKEIVCFVERGRVSGCNERPLLSMHPPIRRIPYCIVARERNAQI